MHIQTRDLEEAVHAVGSVYCPHELQLDRRASLLDTRLTASTVGNTSVVKLAYGAHVTVDAGTFPDLYLFMRCVNGDGLVRHGTTSAAWFPGTTIPVSAGRQTRFDFGSNFVQATFRPDADALQRCCARLLGHPLDDTLSFELLPFSPEFERMWTSVLCLLGTLPATQHDSAATALEEFVLTSLLTGHRHNYTDLLLRRERVSRPSRLVDRAEAYIKHHINETTLTASDIAEALGVSVRTLQSSFQERRRITPTAYLRQIRLEQVRERLLNGPDGERVIDIALEHGFLHLGRFAQQYKRVYGEAPSDTLRLRRRFRGDRD
jgi:AraC-like DNA-binding protein